MEDRAAFKRQLDGVVIVQRRASHACDTDKAARIAQRVNRKSHRRRYCAASAL
jgi:hypothetical protein